MYVHQLEPISKVQISRLLQAEIFISSCHLVPMCNVTNSIILGDLIFKIRDDVRRAIDEMK